MERQTFGAPFVEVGIDGLTSKVRVRRMLAAGRILNPETARGQVIGAMICRFWPSADGGIWRDDSKADFTFLWN